MKKILNTLHLFKWGIALIALVLIYCSTPLLAQETGTVAPPTPPTPIPQDTSASGDIDRSSDQCLFSEDKIKSLALKSNISFSDLCIPPAQPSGAGNFDQLSSSSDTSDGYRIDAGDSRFVFCQKIFRGRQKWRYYQKNFHYTDSFAEMVWAWQWLKAAQGADKVANFWKGHLEKYTQCYNKNVCKDENLPCTMKTPPSEVVAAEGATVEECKSYLSANTDGKWSPNVSSPAKMKKQAQEYYVAAWYKLAQSLLYAQKSCASVAILTSFAVNSEKTADDVQVTDRAGNTSTVKGSNPSVSSTDGKITCETAGRATADYDQCGSATSFHNVVLVGEAGLQTAAELLKQNEQNNQQTRRQKDRALAGGTNGNQNAEAPLKNQLGQTKVTTQIAMLQAAFWNGAALGYTYLVNLMPDREEVQDYLGQVWKSDETENTFGHLQFAQFMAGIKSKVEGDGNDVIGHGIIDSNYPAPAAPTAAAETPTPDSTPTQVPEENLDDLSLSHGAQDTDITPTENTSNTSYDSSSIDTTTEINNPTASEDDSSYTY